MSQTIRHLLSKDPYQCAEFTHRYSISTMALRHLTFTKILVSSAGGAAATTARAPPATALRLLCSRACHQPLFLRRPPLATRPSATLLGCPAIRPPSPPRVQTQAQATRPPPHTPRSPRRGRGRPWNRPRVAKALRGTPEAATPRRKTPVCLRTTGRCRGCRPS